VTFKALRFDERTATFDHATKTIQGPVDVLMRSSSEVAIICDAPWDLEGKHSFFVVRESRRIDGTIEHRDIAIFPPGRYPHEFGPIADIDGSRAQLDREMSAFMRRLAKNQGLVDTLGGRQLDSRHSRRRRSVDTSDGSLRDDPDEAVKSGTLSRLVAYVISSNTSYKGRIRIHLRDLSYGIAGVHVYCGVDLIEVKDPSLPYPTEIPHQLYYPLYELLSKFLDYSGEIWLIFEDTPPCDACGYGYMIKFKLNGDPASLTHGCDPVRPEHLLPSKR